MQLKLWINAFIPKDVAGYTRTIRCGAHAGKTAVPLPLVARLNPINLFKNVNAGYLTDQRGFDPGEGASSRMHSMLQLNLATGIQILRQEHISSGTTEVDIETGKQLGFGTADMSRCTFGKLQPVRRPGGSVASPQVYRAFPIGTGLRVARPAPVPANTPEEVGVTLDAAAGDPLVSTAADIDYEGRFLIKVYSRSPYRVRVELDAKIDAFPAFEAYAALGASVKTLFRAAPPPGNTVTDLAFGASRDVSAAADFP